MPDLPAGPLALVLLAVAIGGTIQGAIGFGFALICVPMLALTLPEAVPYSVLFLALPLTIWMALRERAHIDVRGFVSILAGRVLGTAAGVWILVAVPTEALSVLLGTLIVLGVLVSILGLDVEPTRAATFGAGIVSGIMGTASAIGGPALVVVYQRRPGPELRSTLALSFTVGLLMSIGALLAAGEVRAWHGILALELLPALVLGVWLSGPISRFLDARWLRPAVLAFAGMAGVVIVARGLLG